MSSFLHPGSSFVFTRLLSALVLTALLARSASAQTEFPLWDPSSLKPWHQKPESSEDRRETGRTDRWISYVSTPTLTFYPAPGTKSPSPTVLVIPGGGFRYVCIDKEGVEVAQWLNTLGVSAAVLKYRTLDPSAERSAKTLAPIFPDTERAVRILRSRAQELGIDPKKLGVIGFSAGAVMSAKLILDADAGDPAATDAAERESSRPDFVGLIYGAPPPGKDAHPPKDCPPVFIAHAADDPKAPVKAVMKMYQELLEASAPTELHVFQNGNHGFGVRPPAGTAKSWPLLFSAWLRELDVVAAP